MSEVSTIYLNDSELNAELQYLSQALVRSDFHKSAKDFSEFKGKSVAFDAYIENYEKIVTIMQNYYSLLSKDMEAIRAIESEIKNLDESEANSWNTGN